MAGPPSLADAVALHRDGRLAEAEAAYRKILAGDADRPDALNLLGVVRLQSGDPAEARQLTARAVALRPDNPDFHASLGTACLELGDAEAAERAFRDALARDPDHGDALYNLAGALQHQGRSAAAADPLRRLLDRQPDEPALHVKLALCLADSDAADAAVAHFERALALDPDDAVAHNLFGTVLQRSGRRDDAERQYRAALALRPGYADAHLNIGNLKREDGRLDDALAAYRRALEIDPAFAAAHNNLANALFQRGETGEARRHVARALEIDPRYADAHNNLGEISKALGDLDAAERAYDCALEIDPGHNGARFGRALVRLLRGNFAAGWEDYLARGSMEADGDRFHRAPLAGDLDGTRILVERDQGLGDELFFLRFLPLLRARGAWVAYLPDPRLAPMLERAAVADRVIGDALPEVDLTVSVGDLPWLLGAPDPLPSIRVPADAAVAERIGKRLAAFGPPPYVGVTWRAGSRGADRVLFKAAPMEAIARALGPASGTVIAVQRLPADGEVAEFAAALGRPVGDLTALNEDLEAMLALCAALDDYVCVSNTNVHLRDAGGRTSGVLVPNPPEFRWLAQGAESPWFPGSRVYRQAQDGSWDEAFAGLARDLAAG